MASPAEYIAVGTTLAVILNAWVLWFINGMRTDVNNLWGAIRELEKMVFLGLSNGSLPHENIKNPRRMSETPQ